MIKVTCFGAAGSVTGSNFLIETPNRKHILIDCGLFQGSKEMENRNREPWGFNPGEVKTLILTHAHIDHSGRIPKLVKDGFRGTILTSPPTAELSQAMLLDSAHVQEMESEWRTRKNKRQGKDKVEPLYTTRDAEDSLRYFVPVKLDAVTEIEPGIQLRLRNSGHILGSCAVELWVKDDSQTVKIVFSGDLGRQDPLLVNDAAEIGEADYLFVESTYGNRLHRNFEESKREFLEAINYAVYHKEKVIIPAFALERTQEVLYILGEFSRAGQLPHIPIYLDSPLAIRATEIFRKNREYYDDEAKAILGRGIDPLSMPNLKFTLTTRDSMKINQHKGSAIIISANGMCTAGRIKHHLKHNLWRPGAAIVIVGFQGQGTTGRQIVEGAKSVTIFGEKIAVRAKVFTIGGISAHADQADLLRWVGHFAKVSKPKVFVIHGEMPVSQTFAQLVQEKTGLKAYVPQRQEVLSLPKDLSAVERRVADKENLITRASEIEADMQKLKNLISTGDKIPTPEEIEALQQIVSQLKAIVEK